MDQVQEVREKTDIVQLISEYLPLKQVGRNFKVNCPFHQEKTASFVVSPERQIWHCFGCQKGGDVFTFLMEYEHMEFAEALRFLAKRAGIILQDFSKNSQAASQKEKLYAINHLSAEFYHYLLTKHKVGKKAYDYLINERGLKPQVIETFKIGFAPRVGNALVKFLINNKQYKAEDVLLAGLAVRRGKDLSDFFFGRLMFPLIDHRDNVVGFSGRALDNSVPKYINTRETPVYIKGNQLFGINITKNEIKQKRQALLVEGEFDVMSLYQAGIGNAVGIKGTALTSEQVNLLARFTPKITMCLDSDAAGITAMVRSIPLLEQKELTTTVVTFSNGKDPDEAVKDNEYAVKDALKHDENVFDFLLQAQLKLHHENTPEAKAAIAKNVLPIFTQISNEIIKEHYLKKLATALGTSYESVQKEVDKLGKVKVVGKVTTAVKPKTHTLAKEDYVLSLLLQLPNPKQIIPKLEKQVQSYEFTNPAKQRLVQQYTSYVTQVDQPNIEGFAKTVPQELVPTFDVAYLSPLPEFSDDAAWEKELAKKIIELRQQQVKKQLAASSTEGFDIQKLQQEYKHLQQQLNSL